MDYCEKHKNNTPPEIEKPIKSVDMSENVSDPWDAKYIEIENLEDLFELILAANFLDIKSLLDLSCAKVATMIKGCSLKLFSEKQKLFKRKIPRRNKKDL